ncbi:FUSC family protein [Streptomyces sp. NPDC058683]|uniref:FUSC family protein n=1 Tax=Streptomyces sp. NPDC058683 TaxID=3346597 RepID=UPI0036628702
MLTRAQALPGAVVGATVDNSAPADDSAPSAGRAGRALDQEMRRVLAEPKRSSTGTLLAADATRCRPPRRIRSLRRRERAMVIRGALLTLVCGATTVVIGLDRWYWAPVCAVATLWGSHSWMTWYRAAQRGLATVVGGGAGMALLQPHLAFPVVTVLVAVLFFLAELSLPRNYGLAMLFVTPMVLLTIRGASSVPLDAAALSWDRTATTLIGCVSGVLGVLVLLPCPSTHLLVEGIAHSVRFQQALLAEILATPLDGHARLCAIVRRDLVELDTLAEEALGEARSGEQARALRPVAVSVKHPGYLLLALSALKPECWPEMGQSDPRRRGLEEAAAASLHELSAPRPDLQPILDRELQIVRSLLSPHLA